MKNNSKFHKNPAKRPLGLYRGQIWMAPDFDAPLELVESSKLAALMNKKAVSQKKAKPRRSKKENPSR